MARRHTARSLYFSRPLTRHRLLRFDPPHIRAMWAISCCPSSREILESRAREEGLYARKSAPSWQHGYDKWAPLLTQWRLRVHSDAWVSLLNTAFACSRGPFRRRWRRSATTS